VLHRPAHRGLAAVSEHGLGVVAEVFAVVIEQRLLEVEGTAPARVVQVCPLVPIN
jgi:hypothetical protein